MNNYTKIYNIIMHSSNKQQQRCKEQDVHQLQSGRASRAVQGTRKMENKGSESWFIVDCTVERDWKRDAGGKRGRRTRRPPREGDGKKGNERASKGGGREGGEWEGLQGRGTGRRGMGGPPREGKGKASNGVGVAKRRRVPTAKRGDEAGELRKEGEEERWEEEEGAERLSGASGFRESPTRGLKSNRSSPTGF
ncbi:hypothetical protein H6P81_016839 [Aristolochia fimbriata]|uniref:Uncharacterized protein n=1 Tax=Aristolochia fimbriata TaxID=158543 RepID=A0AAV7DWH1_ARIFI|nr:hypothetical protein H6P81_016839 [Aristolochia fimbriata]